MKMDDKGNVAIVVALCLPLIIGGAAFGVEVGYWRYDQVRLQQGRTQPPTPARSSSERAARQPPPRMSPTPQQRRP